MPKRKSGNDQDPKKTKQQKGEVKVKVNRPPYVENMIEWNLGHIVAEPDTYGTDQPLIYMA